MKLNIYNEQSLDLLHFIFERELKPPFRKGEKDEYSRRSYYNRDNEHIGWLTSADNLLIKYNPYWDNILHKVCQVFELPNNKNYLWNVINPYLISWLGSQLNVKLSGVMKLNIGDEQGIEILHLIFERELKPPFRKGKKDVLDSYPYYNRNNECIGWLDEGFELKNSVWLNIKYKVCQVFEFSYDGWDLWFLIKPHLKPWMEDKLNIKLDDIFF